jgi:hypothetical protein
MTGKTIAAMLAVLASIATILGFVLTVAHGSSSPASSQITTVTSSSPASMAYPSSAEQSFLATCESYTGLPISHCQCDLSWAEANYPYPTSSPAMEMALVQQAENNAPCP